ncbi:Gldg family protein [Sphingomonas cavernae]|nr:Gldg family protein [Sphingomonas cavernae]
MGPLANGRAEPGAFLAARSWLLLILVFWLRPERWPVRWAAGVLGIVLAIAGQALFLGLLGAPLSGEAVLRQAGRALLVLLVLDLVIQVGQLVWLKAGGLIGGVAAVVLVASLGPVALIGKPKVDKDMIALRPSLALVTGLPLVWGEGDINATLRGSRGPAQSYRWLEQNFAISVLDRIDQEALKRHSLLLLAQPRALQPEELVALDAWVRGGGKALVLADPSLRWPSQYSSTDPRAPPAVSLLDPLLDHWGLRLDLIDVHRNRQVETVEVAAAGNRWKLSVLAPGRFVLTGKLCTLQQEGLFARCAIGKGKALLIADADLMADPLWAGEGADGISRERRSADNAPLLGMLLDELSGISRDMSGEWVPWIWTPGTPLVALFAGAIPGLISLSFGLGRVFLVRSRRV